MWCGRTGQPFQRCCDRHPDRVHCRDTTDCAMYSLSQDSEINRRMGL